MNNTAIVGVVALLLIVGGYLIMQGGTAVPWNWGGPGEKAGVQPDAASVASENIIGRWQSVYDEKFVRVFKAGSVVEDWYDGTMVASDSWVAFEKGVNAPPFPHPLEEGVVYIQFAVSEAPGDTMNFKLTKLTAEELELIYLDSGGALRFKRVE
jgi:hypothetical protein